MLCKIDWSFFGTTIWPLVHMSDLKRPLFLPWFLVRVCVHWLLQNADVDADADFDVDFCISVCVCISVSCHIPK